MHAAAIKYAIPKLSDLIIDVDKDWNAKIITNTTFETSSSILRKIQHHLGIFWFNNNWLPSGMINNAISGSGTITWNDLSVILQTGATLGSNAYIFKKAPGIQYVYFWNRARGFGIQANLNANTNQNTHIVSGGISDYTAAVNTLNHIGFKLIDGNLYGTVANGTTESTLLMEAIGVNINRRLEVVFTPGVEARFFDGGNDMGAITTNLPTDSAYADYMLYASVYNTTAINKVITIFESRTLQEEKV